jgi:hypothetical protein
MEDLQLSAFPHCHLLLRTAKAYAKLELQQVHMRRRLHHTFYPPRGGVTPQLAPWP